VHILIHHSVKELGFLEFKVLYAQEFHCIYERERESKFWKYATTCH